MVNVLKKNLRYLMGKILNKWEYTSDENLYENIITDTSISSLAV